MCSHFISRVLRSSGNDCRKMTRLRPTELRDRGRLARTECEARTRFFVRYFCYVMDLFLVTQTVSLRDCTQSAVLKSKRKKCAAERVVNTLVKRGPHSLGIQSDPPRVCHGVYTWAACKLNNRRRKHCRSCECDMYLP